MNKTFEVNFDGIVGPTHNYAGLSYGNVASQKHARSVSRPRAAALQGLAKMKFLHDLGVPQGVLPPHPRPDLRTLRAMGFSGSDADILQKASREDPRLLAAVYSASAMWAANAATVSPSADSGDGRVHFTPANLITQFHRSIEASFTAMVLRAVFPEGDPFAHHDPLPAADAFADEGAANHMRMTASTGGRGIEIFVYGRSAVESAAVLGKFPARQTLSASQAIARRHQVHPEATVFARQSPEAIDAGAFHNDVVAVSHDDVLLMHEAAFSPAHDTLTEIRRKFTAICGIEPSTAIASETVLPLATAVETYLFNSQLVTLANGKMALIAPIECRDSVPVQVFLGLALPALPQISEVHYLDVRQSMHNGGGPACLRLRVAVRDEQLRRVHPGVMLNDALYAELVAWVEKHYRTTLAPEDLADPTLIRESEQALDELTGILGLESVYPFQRC